MQQSPHGRREPALNELVGFAGPAFLAREPDERLVALARDGDHNAFAAIVARYHAMLELHCRRMAPWRAEDALQQTFSSAYVALTRGETPIALRAWLYTIARNTCLNALRERQDDRLDIDQALGDQHQPHEIVTRRESLQGVVRAVRSLPPRQRAVIVRQEFHGASHEQIAAELGLSTGAVGQLAHRARRAVRAAAAALIPSPLWQRMPWLSAPSQVQALAGSAGGLGVLVSKTAVLIVLVASAGAAGELTARQPIAASVAAQAPAAQQNVATHAPAGATTARRQPVTNTQPSRGHGQLATPNIAGRTATGDAQDARPAEQGADATTAAAPIADADAATDAGADPQPTAAPVTTSDATDNRSLSEPGQDTGETPGEAAPAVPEDELVPAPQADAPAEVDAPAPAIASTDLAREAPAPGAATTQSAQGDAGQG